MLSIGTSKKSITPDVSGITMMGWGQFSNKAYGVGMPIYCRSFVFYNKESKKKIVFVCAEIAFITIALKQGVINYLKDLGFDEFDDTNIMISATHTHSAPGGYSHYMMYNLNSYGFVEEVLNHYIKNISESIIEANKNLKKSDLYFNYGEIPIDQNVAFNRSIEAYNLNKDVDKLQNNETNKALDRNMYQLQINNKDNKLEAIINWFSVHCTNVHSDNFLIHPDNKGIASDKFEKDMLLQGNKSFISAFAQGSCGDITPNYKEYKDIPFTRGEFEDDYKSAEYNGNIQYEQAKKLFNLEEKLKLSGNIDYIHSYIDFSNIKIDPEFSNGEEIKTSSASIGVSMIAGTKEGPGITQNLKKIVEKASLAIYKTHYSRLSKEQKEKFKEKIKSQGNKIIFADLGEGSILTNKNLKKLPIPESIDEMVTLLKNMAKNDAIGNKPWTPNILPIQIFIIGELSIIAVPAEFTTIAAKRLKNTVLNILKNQGIKEIVLSGYSNGYAGYVTTNEEYQLQLYEGGSTHFGQWTLSAYQTEFKKLALELLKPYSERKISNLEPHKFTRDELMKRAYKNSSV